MKVTVNFGSVRVIVPCGKGDLPVKELMDLAITRYKKATGKSVDSWVTIHNLKLLSDGGILDPDDQLNDVADDREQITAVFEEISSHLMMHNGGDGTSASSVGTESPDIFQNGDILSMPLTNGNLKQDKLTAGLLPLHVRRGSEPTLNQLSLVPDTCKRWSAAVLASDEAYKRLNSEGEEQSEDEMPPGEREDGSGEEKSLSYQQYLETWNHDIRLNRDERKEPLGGPISTPNCTEENEDSDCSSSSHSKVEIMKLQKEEGPLGISIIPAEDSPEKNGGVIIKAIEPGGRIDRDGRLCVGDRITEINGLKLSKDSYQNAQEILKEALSAPELNIHCIKKDAQIPPPAIPPKPAHKKNAEDSQKVTTSAMNPVLPFLTPTKKLPANVLHKGTPVHSSIRKIGRRILVHLTKGSEGLGFSITSKDPNNGPPFFIKNILPAGAAVDDGRLKTGDKLLEVNKVDVSVLTQPEVLTILKKVHYGEMVELVISRQETDLSPSPSLPRELPPEEVGEEKVTCRKRDIFTFEVPLNDTGSAGLGFSVKGKASNTPNGPVDMGIFIKNIFHGGAAHKDGRLCTNDQLLNVNEISLLGMTNGQAMETLRRTMIQCEGPHVGTNAIILTVARRVTSPNHRYNADHSGESSGHDRSDSLLSESGDSFYVSNENLTPMSKHSNGPTPDTSTSDTSATTVIHMSPNHQPEELSSSPEHNGVLIDLHCDQIANSFVDQSHRSPDLIDLHGASVSGSGMEITKSSLGNYHKTFSNLTEMELYQTEEKEQESLRELSRCSSPTFYKESIKRKRVPMERGEYFRRSGMGRQSMPEKKLTWSYQRNQCPSEDRRHTTTPQVTHRHDVVLRCPYSGVREMPVDVGDFESYSPRAQHHNQDAHGNMNSESRPRNKAFKPNCCWTCNSPDCPYHAVPLTAERESCETEEPVGPTLGLFKSSSLESLQTMLQEQQRHPPGRGCNESFRQAVDKSFDATEQNDISVQPKDETKPHKTGKNHSRAKTVDVIERKDDKPQKKKGLFKGLGSVFKFGKFSKKSGKDSSNQDKADQSELDNLHSLSSSQSANERMVTSRSPEDHPSSRTRHSFTFPRNRTVSPVSSRQDRMNALRTEHQKKHQLRNGYYPQEDREEVYEQRLQEMVDTVMVNRPLPPLPSQQISENMIPKNVLELSPKSKNFEIYKEMSKPGSRKGFADPTRYSHYMNFQEIQQHLQQFRYHQNIFQNGDEPYNTSPYALAQTHPKTVLSPTKRHYRHTVSSPRSRPMSELFDCRTTPDMVNGSLRGVTTSGSLPRRAFQRKRPPIPVAFMNGVRYNQSGVNSGSNV